MRVPRQARGGSGVTDDEMRQEWDEIQSSMRMLAAVLLVTLAGGVAIVLGGLWIAATAIGWVR